MSTKKSRNESFHSQPSVKSGWLKKQGGMVKSWQRRWFVIKGDQLYYFKDEEETKPVGCIFLPGNKIVEHPFDYDDPGKYLFEIVSGDGNRMTTTHDTYPILASCKEERQDWVTALKRVMYAHVGGGIFGQNLQDTMKYEIHHKRGQRIPQIVQDCAEFLKQHGLEVEGIFRLPGRQSLINKIRNQYDCGERPKLNADTIDVHTAASILKMYLRELPEPIIPFILYEDFLSIATSFRYGNTEKGLAKLEEILGCKKMPVHNYVLLHYLSEFLDTVSQHSNVNKMTMVNLALIFGPNIIRSEEDSPESMMGTQNLTQHLTFALINNHKTLFKMDYSSGNSIRTGDLLRLDSNQSTTSSEGGKNTMSSAVPLVVKELEDLDFSGGTDQLEPPLSDASDNSEESLTNDPQPNQMLESDSIRSLDSGLGDSNDHVVVLRRNKLRPAPPVPLPRRSLSLNSAARDTKMSAYAGPLTPESEEEERFDDLPDSVPELQKMVKELRLQVCSVKAQYKNKLSNMAKRLNQQQEATDQAVNRVVLLQTKLQEYQLKYDSQ